MTKKFSWGRGFTFIPCLCSPHLDCTLPQSHRSSWAGQKTSPYSAMGVSVWHKTHKSHPWIREETKTPLGDQEAEPGQPAQPRFCSLVPSPQQRTFSSPGDII